MYADLWTPSAYSDRVFSAADFLIGRAAAACRTAGAALTVASVPITTQVKAPAALRAVSADPARLDVRIPDRKLEESCRKRAVPFVALSERLRFGHYWREDMRWNAAGHRLVADWIRCLPV